MASASARSRKSDRLPSQSASSRESKKLPPQPVNGNGNGYGGPKVRDRLCQLIRQHQLDASLVKSYAVDFCGTKSLRDATREQVENFVTHLADWAEKDRNALLCQLNSYLRQQGRCRMRRYFKALHEADQSRPCARFPTVCSWSGSIAPNIAGTGRSPITCSASPSSNPSIWPDASSRAALYCTPKALWKLSWFLRDFGYDTELLGRDEIDERP